MDERANIDGADGGGGLDDDAGGESTAVSDVTSLHLVRLARAIVKDGHAGAKFGEALGGVGLALRWAGHGDSPVPAGKRVMFLIAAQDKIREAKKRLTGIIEHLDDADRLVEEEANSLHMEENGP